MDIALIITFGLFFASIVGILIAIPSYYIGKFIRRQILDDKYYHERTSQLKRLVLSTPIIVFFSLLFGATINLWYESVILFSLVWGAVWGYMSLENFADTLSANSVGDGGR